MELQRFVTLDIGAEKCGDFVSVSISIYHDKCWLPKDLLPA